MMLTKEILSEIKPSEIFKVVTTRVQNFHEPMIAKLKFICVKGAYESKEQGKEFQQWAIYAGLPEQSDDHIRFHGDKVHSLLNIQSICPCDEGAYDLYRH